MSDLVDIKIDRSGIKAALDKLAAAGNDLTPVMRKFSQTLASATDQNFIAEGRPQWQALSEVTKQFRLGKKKKMPEKGFRILQKSGSLASSVNTRYDESSLAIGTNKVYGRIHQKGGKAGRGLRVTIPARPYLPVTADDKLQPEAEQGLMETLNQHFETAAGK